MSTQKPPLTAAEHIDQANSYLHEGGSPTHAIAHALIAIAELMATNMTNVILDATARGATAMAETIGTVNSMLGIVPPSRGPAPCYVCQSVENVVDGWYCTSCATSGRR